MVDVLVWSLWASQSISLILLLCAVYSLHRKNRAISALQEKIEGQKRMHGMFKRK